MIELGAVQVEVEKEGPAPKSRREAKAAGTVRCRVFRQGRPSRAFQLRRLPELVSGRQNMAWVDLESYTAPQLRQVGRLLKLPRGNIQATLAPWRRPKVDLLPGLIHVAVTVAHVHPASRLISAGQLDIFIGRNFFVTAHKNPLPFQGQIQKRLDRSPKLAQLHSAYVLFLVLDELLEYYGRLYEGVEAEIEKVEEQALRQDSDRFLEQMLRLKRFVFELGRLVDQHRPVFAEFTRPDFVLRSGQQTQRYYRDLQERLGVIVDRLTAARDTIVGAFDIHLSHVASRTNQVVKILTVVSTVVLPVTVVISFFGTNFSIPALKSTTAFAVMMAALLVVPAAILLVMRKQRWI